MSRVHSFLEKKFEANPKLAESLVDLYRDYVTWDLMDTNFDKEFTDGDDGHFYSYLWEMLLARHFKKVGLKIGSKDEGPDFKIELAAQTIWVEAICPSPSGLSEAWLRAPRPGEVRVFSVPHEEILLRWTAALKEKKEKLTGRQSREIERTKPGYLDKGIVGNRDPYVIAIGACRLGYSELDLHVGISQLPYAVETVFPIGPLQVKIDCDTLEMTDTGLQHRRFIRKPTGVEVPTDSFLNPDYSGISAVLGSPAGLNAAGGNPSRIALVHNPFADNPLPVGILGVDEEFVAENRGDSFELRDIRNSET